MTTLLETENGRQWTVLAGTIVFPLRGILTARLDIDADGEDPLPTGAASLLLAADGDGEPVELVGTIGADDARTFEGRAQALFVGGAGGLALERLPARTYQQAPLETEISTIVADAIEEAGEQFEIVHVDGSVPRWHRVGDRTAAQLLDRFSERFGVGWRMSDDGIVVVAPELWPEADTDDAALLIEGPDDAINRTLAGSVGRASLRPGTSIGGRRIEEVVYSLDERGMRVLLRYGPGTGPGGLRGDLEEQVRAGIPPLPYREHHAATVRRQNADGTLDLEADDAAIGGLPSVPYAPGIVGCRLVIAEGERVRLAFEGGDESKPYASAWDPITGGEGVARLNDTVRIGTLVLAPAGPTPGGPIVSIAVTYSPIGSPVQTAVIAVGTPMTITLSGVISSASEEVFIRAPVPA
jgi:hypothetical protein